MEWLKHLVVRNDGKGILVNDQKQGTRYIKGHDEIQLCEYNFVNHKFHGTQREWYCNGQKSLEYNYINGEQHGIQRHWFGNGQLHSERNYVDGVQHGIQREWREYGKEMTTTYYINGVEQWLKKLNISQLLKRLA
jgi:antitoxin component YwqK of YwqJK toxin-antitoxin module